MKRWIVRRPMCTIRDRQMETNRDILIISYQMTEEKKTNNAPDHRVRATAQFLSHCWFDNRIIPVKWETCVIPVQQRVYCLSGFATSTIWITVSKNDVALTRTSLTDLYNSGVFRLHVYRCTGRSWRFIAHTTPLGGRCKLTPNIENDITPISPLWHQNQGQVYF